MVKQTQIDRGKKWTTVRATAVFENRTKDIEWMDSQQTIINDIQAYEDSIKTEAKPETKAKKAKDE